MPPQEAIDGETWKKAVAGEQTKGSMTKQQPSYVPRRIQFMCTSVSLDDAAAASSAIAGMQAGVFEVRQG